MGKFALLPAIGGTSLKRALLAVAAFFIMVGVAAIPAEAKVVHHRAHHRVVHHRHVVHHRR